MNSAIERLLSLRVADVMQRNVVTLATDEQMSDAAETFLRHDISGAPVIDSEGACVGQLSAADFVRREAQRPLRTTGNSDGIEEVRTYMTSVVQSIDADASLIDAARVMCRNHVHRLPALDRRKRVAGVVSSLDLVAAMIHAIEE